MSNSKTKTFFTAIGWLIKGIWKLFLLGVYFLAKVIETIASFVGKITDKLLN